MPTKDLSLVFAAEFLGCLFFTFCTTLNNTPWTNAAVLSCWVYFSSHVSSAHLNPALSLAFVLLGHHHFVELHVYLTAQLTGSLCGAAIARFLVPWSVEEEIGCFKPAPRLDNWQIFGFECMLTASFIVSVFVVVFYTRDKLGFGNMGPMLIGLALLANGLAGGAYTGCALNPARVFASPIVIGCTNNNYVAHAYILGEFTGALIAVVIVSIFFGVNANAWFAKYIRPEHQVFLPAFEYSVRRHPKGPQTMQEVTNSVSRRFTHSMQHQTPMTNVRHENTNMVPSSPEVFPLIPPLPHQDTPILVPRSMTPYVSVQNMRHVNNPPPAFMEEVEEEEEEKGTQRKLSSRATVSRDDLDALIMTPSRVVTGSVPMTYRSYSNNSQQQSTAALEKQMQRSRVLQAAAVLPS